MESQYSYAQDLQSPIEDIFQVKNKIRKQNKQKWAQGIWTQIQRFKYIAFILYNKDFLNSKLQRRKNKIFKQMSNFIMTRNPTQCRSQNQKMFRRYKTLHKIVIEFKKEYGVQKFQNEFKNISNQIGIKMAVQSESISRGQSQNHQMADTKRPELLEAQIQTDGQVTVVMSKADYDLWKMFNDLMKANTKNQQISNTFYVQPIYFQNA